MTNITNIYVAILFISGIIYIFITPPFQVPDAPAHFYRAYQISQGEMISEKRGQRTGGEIPYHFHRVQSAFGHLRYEPTEKVSLEKIIHVLSIKEESPKQFVGFENTAVFSPIPYIPAALGIIVSKLASDSVLMSYYFASVFTLIASLIAIRLAMTTLPQFNILIFAFCMLPMFMFQLASFSSDSLSNSIAILFICYVFSLSIGNQKLNKNFIVKIFITGALLALCKQTHSILFILTALILPSYFNNWTNYFKYQLIFCTTILAVLIGWQYIVNDIYSPLPWIEGANAKLQLLYVINNPGVFMYIAGNDLLLNFEEYVLLMGGAKLGWLDTHLPPVIIWMHLVSLLVLAYSLNTTNYKLTAWQYTTILVSLILGIIIIKLALYLHAQPVGSSKILGIHGRYFLHLAFVFLLMITTLPKIFEVNKVQFLLVKIFPLLFLTSVPIIITRYYL